MHTVESLSLGRQKQADPWGFWPHWFSERPCLKKGVRVREGVTEKLILTSGLYSHTSVPLKCEHKHTHMQTP